VQQPRRQDSNTCLIVGLIMAGVAVLMIPVIGILAAIMLPALARAREAARRASCANNLKQVGLICKMYANENPDGYFPPLSSQDGMFMFAPDSVYPEYLTDPNVLVCPSDADMNAPGTIDDKSYYYLGYAFSNESEALAFLDSYPDFIAQGVDFTQDLPAPPGEGSFGGDMFLRLDEDVCNDTGFRPGQIPIMFDVFSSQVSSFNHVPGGCNVLYLDGTVQFMRYPGEFPMTQAVGDALSILDR
jgi:prepilin-type processing-associated H-X9-DG protein